MTEKEYIESGGTKCPICQSNNLSADGQIISDGLSAWGLVECHNCGAKWNDVYELIGIQILEEKEDKNDR